MATKKAKKATAKAPAKKALPKTEGRRGRGGGINKSAFIREQPATMSAKEVVEAAAAEGIVLTEGFVYNVRSNAKSKAKETRQPVGRQPGRPQAAAKVTLTTSASDEAAFRQLVVAMGTTRAKELVAEVEERLVAVIAGQ